jgi:hypothetical protein
MKVFFYGLFMDTELLKRKGIHSQSEGISFLDNYTIKIGERATLTRCDGEKAFGVVMELEQKDVRKLYSDPGVSDYMPEEVSIITGAGETVNAICYILKEGSTHVADKVYATELFHLVKKLGFADEYLKKIEEFSSNSSDQK